jgi:hypothetical protein
MTVIKLAMVSENVGIIGEWNTDNNTYSVKFPAWLRINVRVALDQKGREFWSFAKNVAPFDGISASDDTVEIAPARLVVYPFEIKEKELEAAYNDLIKKHVEHCSGLVSTSGAPLGMELRKPVA